MHPNQLLVRFTQLGDRASFWIISIAGTVILARLAWSWAGRQPPSLAVELKSLLLLLPIVTFPPSWRAIGAVRRRYRARGLLPYRPLGVAALLLAIGILYGAVFPLWLAIDLIRSSGPGAPVTEARVWFALAYLLKTAVALWATRMGFRLLARPPGPSHLSGSKSAA